MIKNIKLHFVYRIIFISKILILVSLFLSCQSFVNKEEQHKTSKVYEQNDLLRYLIREDNFKNENNSLVFKNVYFKKQEFNEYSLQIKVENSINNDEFHQNYYMIFAIYPLDKDLKLLSSERIKYGFESYSIKIRKNELNDLIIARRIKTKLDFARAITITILDYKTKIKIKEIVLKNVNF